MIETAFVESLLATHEQMIEGYERAIASREQIIANYEQMVNELTAKHEAHCADLEGLFNRGMTLAEDLAAKNASLTAQLVAATA